MKIGSHLRVRTMGDCVMGVTLEGNPKKPEPEHFRVEFPGGDVDIVRVSKYGSEFDYWIHLRLNKNGDDMGKPGKVVDARIDVEGKHANQTNVGDLRHPDLYHLAIRVGT